MTELHIGHMPTLFLFSFKDKIIGFKWCIFLDTDNNDVAILDLFFNSSISFCLLFISVSVGIVIEDVSTFGLWATFNIFIFKF